MSTQVLIRQYSNVAGLALIAYDGFLTWDREFQFIWRGSRWWIKLSFFTARYLALAAQMYAHAPSLNEYPSTWALILIPSFAVVHSMPTVLLQMNRNCLALFRVQVGSILLLLGNMELVMILRVHALYGQNRIIGLCLLTWFLISRADNIWIFVVVPSNMPANVFCVAQKTVMETKQFGSVVLGSILVFGNQTILWTLTYWSYRHSRKPGWSDNPLVQLVMRDNSWALLMLSGALLSVLPYSVYMRQAGQVLACILTCALSVLTCRLILNTRCLKDIGDGIDEPVLSTFLSSVELGSVNH